MALVNMDYRAKNVPEKIARVRTFISRLTGNANFATPNPSLTMLTTACDALETAYNDAQGGSKASKQILAEAKTVMDALITTLGAYIQSESGGDELKIISSGALVKRASSRAPDLSAPVGLLATVSTSEGCVELKWKPVKGAKSYDIEIATDLAGTEWEHLGSCTSGSFTATDLESGKKYLFRVAALNGAGLSPWSDPAVGMAG